MHKIFRRALFRTLVAAAFAALGTTAQAGWVSGNFDPPAPDLSGTFTFELNGSSCFDEDGSKSVNSDSNNCEVSLTHLTVLYQFPLTPAPGVIPDSADITGIYVLDGQLAGVDSNLIGPLTGPAGDYAGPWWIQFASFGIDPVYLYDCSAEPESCLVATANNVTFFTSDANGNPIPEPGSLLLIGAALGAGWLARRRGAG